MFVCVKSYLWWALWRSPPCSCWPPIWSAHWSLLALVLPADYSTHQTRTDQKRREQLSRSTGRPINHCTHFLSRHIIKRIGSMGPSGWECSPRNGPGLSLAATSRNRRNRSKRLCCVEPYASLLNRQIHRQSGKAGINEASHSDRFAARVLICVNLLSRHRA